MIQTIPIHFMPSTHFTPTIARVPLPIVAEPPPIRVSDAAANAEFIKARANLRVMVLLDKWRKEHRQERRAQ